MAFDMKKAGRSVNKVFSTQIGRNMEIYVDDILIKSREAEDNEANIRESSKNLRRNKLRLNPDKCSPKTQKEAHRLTGRIVAVTRFISRAGDWSLPFVKAIRKGKEFEWTSNCEKLYQELKQYLQSPSAVGPTGLRGCPAVVFVRLECRAK
ncbi:hypothetical protein LIER_00894 [Lithospermum erythrorhizon]|uniref:Reverse transcriptase domain-containing protein n=1 Tax=Lithospermum erythrorhizon TaxID=34254 RepID=A0AAV3NK32_LITER